MLIGLALLQDPVRCDAHAAGSGKACGRLSSCETSQRLPCLQVYCVLATT